MRTIKQFSPGVLERFERTGRGLGRDAGYLPWHQVTRSEPASRGRSHLIPYSGRHLHLLSDQERTATVLALLSPGVVEVREQFALSLSPALNELSDLSISHRAEYLPGTLEIASALGVRHPKVTGPGCSAAWVMTTDLLLTVTEGTHRSLIAVASKPTTDLAERAVRLLRIEQQYWSHRGVPWILVTPQMYDARLGRCISREWPSMLLAEQARLDQHELRALRSRCARESLRATLAWLANEKGSLETAKAALWQSVLRRQLFVDLRRSWRPDEPLRLIDERAFDSMNPIASRRSAWI